MIAAIMQPTYLPWPGFFDLLDQSDVFVFLDTVQFEKQSWQQRNRIKTPSGPLWLSVPCVRSFGQRIADVSIDGTTHWRRKHWMSIVANYSSAPYWREYRGPLETVYTSEWKHVADLNIHLIKLLTNQLGIRATMLRSSELAASDRTRAARLVEICVQLGADVYLSPRGSSAYLQSEEEFAAHGIRLAFQHYEPPAYPQRYAPFVPYLSVLDLLLNVGPGALELLRSGRRPWLSIADLAAAA
jgi:hypothetical protein